MKFTVMRVSEPIGQFVHKDMVIYHARIGARLPRTGIIAKERGFHRLRRDEKGLQEERPDDQEDEHACNDQRLDELGNRSRNRRPARHHAPSRAELP